MNDKVQNGEVIIDIKDLSKAFGDLKVLTNISTQIRKGDVVCVIGPSGSGKSTFLRCMNLLETPTADTSILRERISRIRRQALINFVRKWEWYSSSSTCSRT